MTQETFAFIDDVTAGATSGGSRCSSRCTPTTGSRSRSRDRSTGSTTSRCRRWCSTPSWPRTPTRCSPGAVRPTNSVTVLDTHDGIGVIDVGADGTDRSRPGLLAPEQLDAPRRGDPRGLGRHLAPRDRSGGLERRPLPGELHLLRRPRPSDDRYLLARALQFWTPGIPQVYYVGLLAGRTTSTCSRGARSAVTSTATTTLPPRSMPTSPPPSSRRCSASSGSATRTRRSTATSSWREAAPA